MRRCKQMQQWMIEARFGELGTDKQKKLDTHLETCAACRARNARLSAAMNRMDRYARPEPDEAFWNAYWNKLEARLPEQKSSFGESVWDGLIRLLKPASSAGWSPRLAFGAAAILVIGILIGRTFFSNPQVIVQPARDKKGPDLFMQTSQYVERSKLILLGIVNAESDDLFSGNFSRQQSMSRQLVSQSEPLKTALSENRQYMLEQLVEELEVILLQIANLESDRGIEGVDLIRSGAESSAILMKINLGQLLLSRPQQTSEPKDDMQNT